jgi:hypothetical protein
MLQLPKIIIYHYLPKLTLNLVIYSTRSWGNSTIGSTVSLGAPSGCDLGGESLVLSTETSQSSTTFSFASKFVYLFGKGWLPNVSSTSIPTSFIAPRKLISIFSSTSWASFACVAEVDMVGIA